MKVKIKKLHPDAVIPRYSKAGDAGMDLVAVENATTDDYGVATIKTGLAIEIPEGHVGLIFPRSSIYKTVGRLANCVGVIDSGYRGEVTFKFDTNYLALFKKLGYPEFQEYAGKPYLKGDRVGQIIIMPYPQIEFDEVDELTPSDRGHGGFGSTGN